VPPSLWDWVNGRTTVVNQQNALGISTVYSCVDTVSKTFASLPAQVMKQNNTGDKFIDRRHPMYRMLTKAPSEYCTAYEGKRKLCVDHLIWGNGYQIKIRDARKKVIALINIDPWNVLPFRTGDNRLYYQVYDEHYAGTYPARDVIHLRDIGYHSNSDLGMSKIELHATTIGKEKAASYFIKKFYENGMFLGGAIEYPKEIKLDQKDIEALRQNFKDYYGGIEKGAGVGIITGGGTLKQFKSEMPLSNAQYVESAKLNKVEICSIYSVPPPKIGITEGTPYNSLESLNVDYWQNCILPIVTMYEQEVALKCFDEDDTYINHNFDSVLRADLAAMAEFYTKLFRIGVYSRNDIRAKFEENKIPDGDRYFIEGNNMVPADKFDQIQSQNNEK
jgi:HK97 family phage portal protein